MQTTTNMYLFLITLRVIPTVVGKMSAEVKQDLITPMKDFGEACGYEGCPTLIDGALNVHIVPHTHGEMGYTHTFYEHYTGYDKVYEKSIVNWKRILDFVLTELWNHEHRTFTLSDTPYLYEWWDSRDSTVHRMVYQLMRQGRLHIVGGGWSMPDESSTSYHAIIDQFTHGFRKLNKTFGECGRPLVAWQADVYGHSREFTNLAAMLGYDGLFINPISFEDELARMNRRELEMLWRGSDDLGPESDIFTHKLFDGYWPPPGFCFGSFCNDTLIVTSDSLFRNVDERADAFIDSMKNRQGYSYATSHVMVVMGKRMGYFDALMWFRNIDALMLRVNEVSSKRGDKVYATYSAPACYLKAVYESSPALPIKQDDFMPITFDKKIHFTGHFTSRPTVKYLAREGHVHLQIVKQMQVLAGLSAKDAKLYDDLTWVVGAFQDHNVMSGEMRAHVKDYYTEKMHLAMKKSTMVLKKAFNKLRNSPSTTSYYRCKFNISSCRNTNTLRSFIVVYNPLSWPVTVPVRLPVVRHKRHIVYTPRMQTVRAVSMKISPGVLRIPRRGTGADHELVFLAENLPPMGYRSYYIESSTLLTEKKKKRSIIKKLHKVSDKKYLSHQTDQMKIDDASMLDGQDNDIEGDTEESTTDNKNLTIGDSLPHSAPQYSPEFTDVEEAQERQENLLEEAAPFKELEDDKVFLRNDIKQPILIKETSGNYKVAPKLINEKYTEDFKSKNESKFVSEKDMISKSRYSEFKSIPRDIKRISKEKEDINIAEYPKKSFKIFPHINKRLRDRLKEKKNKVPFPTLGLKEKTDVDSKKHNNQTHQRTKPKPEYAYQYLKSVKNTHGDKIKYNHKLPRPKSYSYKILSNITDNYYEITGTPQYIKVTPYIPKLSPRVKLLISTTREEYNDLAFTTEKDDLSLESDNSKLFNSTQRDSKSLKAVNKDYKTSEDDKSITMEDMSLISKKEDFETDNSKVESSGSLYMEDSTKSLKSRKDNYEADNFTTENSQLPTTDETFDSEKEEYVTDNSTKEDPKPLYMESYTTSNTEKEDSTIVDVTTKEYKSLNMEYSTKSVISDKENYETDNVIVENSPSKTVSKAENSKIEDYMSLTMDPSEVLSSKKKAPTTDSSTKKDFELFYTEDISWKSENSVKDEITINNFTIEDYKPLYTESTEIPIFEKEEYASAKSLNEDYKSPDSRNEDTVIDKSVEEDYKTPNPEKNYTVTDKYSIRDNPDKSRSLSEFFTVVPTRVSMINPKLVVISPKPQPILDITEQAPNTPSDSEGELTPVDSDEEGSFFSRFLHPEIKLQEGKNWETRKFFQKPEGFLITSPKPVTSTEYDPFEDPNFNDDKQYFYRNSKDNFIKNKYVKVHLDDRKQVIRVTLSNGVEVALSINLYYYVSDDPEKMSRWEDRKPGAYIFKPMDPTPILVKDYVTSRVQKTYLVEEVQYSLSSWVGLVVRLYYGRPLLELDWVVGPIPIDDGLGKDVFIRYSTDLDSGGVFFTDSNGRQTVKRARNSRPTYEPLLLNIPSNFYPVTSKIYIEDTKKNIRFSVLNDRSQGGTSLNDGQIDLMVHRRILTDDDGISAILNDTENGKGIVVRGKHYIYISKADYKPNKIFEKKLAKEIELSPQIYACARNVYGRNMKQIWYGHNNEFKGVVKKLPAGVHILTLQEWNDNSLLLRLENYLEKADVVKSGVKTVNVKNLFANIRIIGLRETTLGGNVWLEDRMPLQWNAKDRFVKNFNEFYKENGSVEYSTDDMRETKPASLAAGVTLTPQQIRTFVLTYEYSR